MNNLNKPKSTWQYFFYILVFLFIAVVIFFLSLAVQAKTIIQDSWEAKENLELAVNDFKIKNFNDAKDKAIIAELRSQKALKEFKNLKDRKINFLYNQYQELEQLEEMLEVTVIVSQSIKKSSDIFKDVYVNQSGANYLDKQEKFFKLQQAIPEINGLQANLSLAIHKIKSLEFNGWLSPFRSKFNTIREDLLVSWTYIDKAMPLITSMPDILGFPEKTNYLFIFQNNDELRPSGGFVGSYAVMQADNAKFKTILTADSYHLDMPVKNTLDTEANSILKKYLKTEKMFFRDANWSPDWQVSAQNLDYVYKKILEAWPEDKEMPFNENFDYIIGITPDLVEALLEITGAIEVEGKIYNSQNFQAQLQKQVEIDYIDQGISSWERKSTISYILKEIETRLLNLKMTDWPEVFYTLVEEAEKKNVLIYAQDQYSQEIIENMGWSGKVQTNVDDYIMVVDANMAALKTDALISRDLNYNLNIDEDYRSHLNLNYRHQGKEINWRTSKYHSYSRIYLPINSTDIRAEGFADGSLNIYKDKDLNKMVVAGYFTINLDSQKEIDIYYNNEISDANDYKLYLQKQPGTEWRTNIKIETNQDIKSFFPSFNSSYDQENNIIKWSDTLNKDQKYNVNF
ncbi:MAG TPA: DUF4012 domain-containing protein [Patescibacteria group bacterium]|nr:DUF4012 domain-containing protein [Patescibacteria group bacterium]